MLEILLIVVAGAVLGFAVLVVIAIARFRSLRSGGGAWIADVEPEHSGPANLIGLASEGTLQSRGVGTLALGASHLIFVQLAPERDILVPRESITSARAARHFMGKTTGDDLLVVTWDIEGRSDAMSLALPDVDVWRQRLA
jgi:hypothetical protein